MKLIFWKNFINQLAFPDRYFNENVFGIENKFQNEISHFIDTLKSIKNRQLFSLLLNR